MCSSGTEDQQYSLSCSGVLSFRWVNLWPPESFAESFTPTAASEEPEVGQQDDDPESDVSPGPANEISSFVFMGNFLLFLALLAGIFIVHVAVASGVEAYWIAKVWTTHLHTLWRPWNVVFVR